MFLLSDITFRNHGGLVDNHKRVHSPIYTEKLNRNTTFKKSNSQKSRDPKL